MKVLESADRRGKGLLQDILTLEGFAKLLMISPICFLALNTAVVDLIRGARGIRATAASLRGGFLTAAAEP